MFGATEGAGRASKQLGWKNRLSKHGWAQTADVVQHFGLVVIAKNLTCAVTTCKSSAAPLAHESVC